MALVDTLTVASAALEHVAALGLDWRGTRFAPYVQIVEEHRRKDSAFIARYRSDPRIARLTFEAGSQLAQLCMARLSWDQLDKQRLRAALKKVLEGPEINDDTDDQPRNTLLELVAASAFADAGLAPALTKNLEDVTLTCPGVGKGAAECKRPLNADGLPQSLRVIGEQLRRRKGIAFGAAVVGAERLARLPAQPHEAANPEELEAASRQIQNIVTVKMMELARDPAVSLVPTAVVGVVVLSAAILVRQPLYLDCACNFSFFPLVHPSQMPAELDRVLQRKSGVLDSKLWAKGRT